MRGRPSLLTPAEERQLRYLLKKKGLHFKDLPPPRLRGAPARDDDDAMLPMVELFLRVAKRDLNMSRDAALRWIVKSWVTDEGKQIFGPTTDAVVRRFRKKLKAVGAAKRKLAWALPVVPRGIGRSEFYSKLWIERIPRE